MAVGSILGKRKRAAPPQRHPYLTGNFAPIQKTCPLTTCKYTGTVPDELIGGQYVRNGSNPVSDQELGRDAHWFDGDGMLSGVLFKRTSSNGKVEPQFVNQYILTDVYLSSISLPGLRKPILPSITTLVNPLSSLLKICLAIFRAILLVILSRLPGSKRIIKKISVANTSIVYHDGRALATCESGPPLRIQLPTLETVGWFNGNRAEGEPPTEGKDEKVLGGDGLLSFMKEWTTAHPRVDPQTNEMIMFHSTFAPPYVHYSVIPAADSKWARPQSGPKLLSAPVPGIKSAKMMHDFGVSAQHTVIMDLPLSLDPLNLAKNTPPIVYDAAKPSRFGIFPRHQPSNVRWFETSACCIFHTADSWDVLDHNGELDSVDMLACRMTSATLVFSAGNVAAPQPTAATVKQVVSHLKNKPRSSSAPNSDAFEKGPQLESPTTERTALLWNPSFEGTDTTALIHQPVEDDECRLYYYSFSMSSSQPVITHQWALTSITFEFPSVRADREMVSAQYIYGCTTTYGSFNSALGRAAKIDALAKIDAKTLIACGKAAPPPAVTGCVDDRSVADILAQQSRNPTAKDAIQIFQLPPHHYAQEPRFIPSAASTAEDDGFLLSYVFDERQLSSEGEPPLSAFSELWIIDAKGMRDVIAKVVLPQRVPYGLHGNWFGEEMVRGQRPFESVRKISQNDGKETRSSRVGKSVIGAVVRCIGG